RPCVAVGLLTPVALLSRGAASPATLPKSGRDCPGTARLARAVNPCGAHFRTRPTGFPTGMRTGNPLVNHEPLCRATWSAASGPAGDCAGEAESAACSGTSTIVPATPTARGPGHLTPANAGWTAIPHRWPGILVAARRFGKMSSESQDPVSLHAAMDSPVA